MGANISPIRSPKIEKFLRMASAFSDTWGSELQAFANENGRGEAIDSIMVHRHLIAHGKYQDSRISLAQLKDYLKKAVEVLVLIESQVRR